MAKQKRSEIRWKVIVVSLALCIFSLLFVWMYQWLTRKAAYTRYPEFGIEIPTDYSVHGIDVSKYQQQINWTGVQAMTVNDVRIRFAFIKATEGNINEDKYFKRNWRNAKKAGLVRGAYHFFLATKSGKTQAENFISRVDLKPGDLPPVLDVEQTYGVAPPLMRQRIKEWLNTVESFYRIKPIIYTNVDFYRQYLNEEFDDYPLWVAHYINKGKPRIYRDWQFWQFSETGRVDGIAGSVDFNVFNGDTLEFRQLLIAQPD